MFHLLYDLYFSISLAWELKFFLFLQFLFSTHLHLRSLYLPITFFSFCACTNASQISGIQHFPRYQARKNPLTVPRLCNHVLFISFLIFQGFEVKGDLAFKEHGKVLFQEAVHLANRLSSFQWSLERLLSLAKANLTKQPTAKSSKLKKWKEASQNRRRLSQAANSEGIKTFENQEKQLCIFYTIEAVLHCILHIGQPHIFANQPRSH